MSHHSSEPAPADIAAQPGWAMGPSNGAAAGLDARGSWLLEPETGTGMLLYPRDWSFAERRDVAAHLRSAGWNVVPTHRFLHITSDGETVIRLLSSTAAPISAAEPSGVVHELNFERPAEAIQASV